jgi:hypothetical protein
MQPSNPITARLAQLQAQWSRFAADDRCCLLRWVIADPHDTPLVEAFFDVEDSDAAIFPDLFLRLESPFESKSIYGRALALELTLRYRQMRSALAEAGMVADWRPPTRAPGSSDAGRLLDVAASFHAYHEPYFRRVALLLAPSAIADRRGWQTWLERAIHEPRSPDVRLVVLDDGRAPALAALATDPVRVRSETVALDLGQAIEEISERAGGLETFGGKFRHLFLQTSRAWAASDAARAEQLAEEALALTDLTSWPSLGFAIHYLMGSGYLSAQDPVKAALRFQQAERLALQAEDRGEPSARTLRLNARMALGAVLISEQAHARAAQVYEDTAPLAASPDSPQLHIECWRMAAYAHERDGQIDRAWEDLLKALAVGNVLPAETRKTTTLPFVGEALLRLARTGHYAGSRAIIDENLRWLLGEDWRDKARAQSPPESVAS